LENKIIEWEEQTKHLRGQEIVCYHVHWSYFLDWLGIKSAGYIELRPGIPPTPKHKREIIELIEEHDIKVVVISSWKDPTRAEEVAESSGSKLVTLPGEVNAMEDAEDYLSWVEYLTAHLIDSFPAKIQNNQSREREQNRERKRGVK
jgi:ABC-type Zn uptake system ZnuABC Zn-binding protein ZnuA